MTWIGTQPCPDPGLCQGHATVNNRRLIIAVRLRFCGPHPVNNATVLFTPKPLQLHVFAAQRCSAVRFLGGFDLTPVRFRAGGGPVWRDSVPCRRCVENTTSRIDTSGGHP